MKRVLALAVLASLVPAAGWAADGDRRRPPAAALSACEGKSTGDAVQFTNRRGEAIQATCREIDGDLVARPDSPRGGQRGERHLARLAEELKLSEAQKAQVQKIHQAQKEKVAPLMKQLRESKAELRQAVHSGAADEAAIRSLAAAQAENKADLLVAKAQAWKQIHALLTPEQQEKAKQMESFGFGKGKGKRCGPRF